MGQSISAQSSSNMKVFLCITTILCVSLGDQTHHQSIKQGNAPSVSHSIHKPHGVGHASVISQPHASPQRVHGYGYNEKLAAANYAPAAIPTPTYHAPAPVYHAAPAYNAPVVQAARVYQAHAPVVHAAPTFHTPAPLAHAAPAYHAPVTKAAPTYHAPAPVVHAAPAYNAPVVKAAPTYHAPVVNAAPAYHAPVVKAAPAYHAPKVAHPVAAYHEESYPDEVSPYTYNYAVADDYSKAAFNAAESSDGASNVEE